MSNPIAVVPVAGPTSPDDLVEGVSARCYRTLAASVFEPGAAW